MDVDNELTLHIQFAVAKYFAIPYLRDDPNQTISDAVIDIEKELRYSGLNISGYAWSCLEAHGHLHDVLEQHFQGEQFPSAILEPGCFTGGLIHFLAMKLNNIPHIAFDLSPVALKVASKFARSIAHPNPPTWLEENFLQMKPEIMPFELGKHCDPGLVVLSNMVANIGQQFERYPFLDSHECAAGLISFSVNQGSVVLVAETTEYAARISADDCRSRIVERRRSCNDAG